jgi:hypothetical protein
MHAFTCNIFSISYYVAAQDFTAMSYDYNARVDSLANAYKQQETAKEQEWKDSENLSDLKSENRETKAKAKEAQRVEGVANDAARESKMRYSKEKKHRGLVSTQRNSQRRPQVQALHLTKLNI